MHAWYSAWSSRYGLLDQWRRLDGDTGNAMVRAIDTGAAVLSLSTFLDFGFESWEEPGYHGTEDRGHAVAPPSICLQWRTTAAAAATA